MMPATDAPRPGSLALSFQEVLTAAARLRWKRQDPRDVDAFRQHCRDALLGGADDARHQGYSEDDVRAASFAITAYLDEAALSVGGARFAGWRNQPVEAELFHSQDGAAGFYRQLEPILRRTDGHATADLIEVFQQCLLLGFLGMHGPATPQRRKLIEECDGRLRGVRGPVRELSPGWRIPARLGPRPAAAGTHTTTTRSDGTTALLDELVRQSDARLAFAGIGGGLRGASAFLVVGQSGSVKTSSILHCGVEKQHLAGDVYRDGNVAPTESANVWLLCKTVFVEAGGPLLADGARWGRLLELLRPSGNVPRAALVCLDAERLHSFENVSRTAQALCARLSEYAQAVGCRIPVYALFTRMDRIPGYLEFVRKLSHEEVSRTVGATLTEFTAPGDTSASVATRIKSAFDGVYRSLALARTQLMHRESDGERSELVYEFPREFNKLKGSVAAILSEMCPPGPGAGPFLRGFYFSGARAIVVEEGSPSAVSIHPQDSIPGATAMFGGAEVRAVAVGREVPQRSLAPTRRKIPQWLFLSNLFHEVLLRDSSEV